MTRVALLLALAACGNGSSSPLVEAGPIDSSTEASHESGTGFPIDDGAAPPDAGSECDQMRAQVLDLQTLARACNPQGVSECGAAVDGICCPVTVSIGNTGPVNDFTQSVTAYKQKCNPDCTKVICGAAPTNVCEGTANKGVCQSTN